MTPGNPFIFGSKVKSQGHEAHKTDVCLFVYLSVYPHDISKIDAARITYDHQTRCANVPR